MAECKINGRQAGATSQQMQQAPHGAVFVWCNAYIAYPRALANKLGRSDLVIVGPGWLTSRSWRGHKMAGIVVDHATRSMLTFEQLIDLNYLESDG